MRRWWFASLLILLGAVAAAAQDRTAPDPEKSFCLLCFKYQVQFQRPEPLMLASAASPQSHTGQRVRASAADLDLDRLDELHWKFHQRFGTKHRPGVYAVFAHLLTGFYGRRPQPYVGWYRGASGFRLLDVLPGHFSIGVEAQRILLSDAEAGSPLVRDVAVCHALGIEGAGPCGSIPFRAGDARYGVAFRWHFK